MRTDAACWMGCLLKRKANSHTSLQEHPFVSFMIFIGRVLCKVNPAMPTWGLSRDYERGTPVAPVGCVYVVGLLAFEKKSSKRSASIIARTCFTRNHGHALL